MARSTEVFLCFDLGGTKLRAALVSAQGRVLTHTTRHIRQQAGLKGLLTDFRELADELPAQKYRCVSVASAGPLHAERGVLLDPTNFFTDQKSWGVVPLVRELRKLFKKPVFLENDAAAAVVAEAWKGGHGVRSKNIVAITLGTGVGIGAVANGILCRAGQGLHPEASHIPICSSDKAYPCGCGAYGCIEAYLSGTHFAHRLGKMLGGRELTGEDCLQLAEQGNVKTLKAFRIYGEHLAQAIRSLAVVFAPESMVLSGGFSRAWPHFLNAAESRLPELMMRYREGVDLLPRICVSKLGDNAGVIGAAFIALRKTKKGR